MQDNFSDYGYGFQTKVLASLISNKSFISEVYDHLKLDYFQSEPIKFLAETILDYYSEYKKPPTLEVFKVRFDSLDDVALEKDEVKKALKQVWKNLESNDLQYIQDQTIKFCQNQEMKAALLMSVDLLKRGDYDRIRKVLDEASQVGVNTDIGLNIKENFERRYQKDSREAIPTPWPEFNELMKGGLAPGELGVGIAPSGVGKSWALAAIGAHAMKLGYRVAHYTLELNEDYTALRYDCIISGIQIEKLEEYQDHIKAKLDALDGEVIVKEYPTKSVSVIGIEAHLNKLRALDQSPDLVIIDYADLLSQKAYKGMDKHESLQELYEDLRGMGGRFGVPIWTVSQSNRSGLSENVVDADNTAGSYGKIFTADFVFSISRKRGDKQTNTGRVLLIKNRFGPDGILFPAKIDLSYGSILLFAENSSQGQEAQASMKTDAESKREMLRQRMASLGKTSDNSNTSGLF